jgi:acyl carrier protein
MIPATYTTVPALPLNSNGKLDPTRLPPPATPADAPRQPPTTETERLVATIWHQLLNLPPDTITKHDNFFHLGGSSLVVMQVISRIRQAFGVELVVAEVFGMPVLCDLAAEVDRLAAEHALGEAELESIDAQLDSMSDEEIDRLLAAQSDGSDDGPRRGAPGLTSGGIE